MFGQELLISLIVLFGYMIVLAAIVGAAALLRMAVRALLHRVDPDPNEALKYLTPFVPHY